MLEDEPIITNENLTEEVDSLSKVSSNIQSVWLNRKPKSLQKSVQSEVCLNDYVAFETLREQ